jgi:hypothetical protein
MQPRREARKLAMLVVEALLLLGIASVANAASQVRSRSSSSRYVQVNKAEGINQCTHTPGLCRQPLIDPSRRSRPFPSRTAAWRSWLQEAEDKDAP